MLEGKLTEVIGDLQIVATQITNQLIAVAPEALALILKITMWESLGNLLTGVVTLALAVVSFYITRFVLAKRRAAQHDRDFDGEMGWELLVGLSSLVTFALGVVTLATFLDIWNWVGVFSPEIKLARQALRAVLGN